MDELIKETHLEESFYLNSISMFMKDTLTINERLHIYFQILTNVNNCSKDLLKAYDIFCVANPGYDYFVLNGFNPTGYTCEILDNVGSWFNVNRNLCITYTVTDDYVIKDANGNYITAGTTEPNEVIKLNNYEYLYYIQATILKNGFLGTYKSITDIYKLFDYGDSLVGKSRITYYSNRGIQLNNVLTCTIYLKNYLLLRSNYQNVLKLFYAGLIASESMGINYTYSCRGNFFLVQFDETYTGDKTVFDPDEESATQEFGVFE